MKRFNDPRLHRRPEVWSDGAVWEVRADYLPPLRVVWLHEFVYTQAQQLWRYSLIILMFCGLAWHFWRFDIGWHLPEGLIIWLAAYVALAPLAAGIEVALGLPVVRALFGRRLRIVFTKDEIIVRRFFRSLRFPRKIGVTFAATQMPGAEHPVYVNSRLVILILGDSTPVRLAEAFGMDRAQQIVSNCNVVNTVTQQGNELDLDPAKTGE